MAQIGTAGWWMGEGGAGLRVGLWGGSGRSVLGPGRQSPAVTRRLIFCVRRYGMNGWTEGKH